MEEKIEAGWTPGPWELSGVRSKINGSDSHSILATVKGKEIVIASVWYDPKTHEGFHDAKFMVAAPDMYEALRAARDAVEGHFDDNCDVCREAIGMINAALARAGGK